MPKLIIRARTYTETSPLVIDAVNGLPVLIVDGEEAQFADPETLEVYEPTWPPGEHPPPDLVPEG